MATILYTALMPDYTYDFVPSDLTRTSGTATSATYRNDGDNSGICASIRLTGTGFTYSGGTATGGTVTGITFLNSAGRSILTVTNASFDLGEIDAIARYTSGTDFHLRSLIFSGDDVMTTGGGFTEFSTGGGNDRVVTSGEESLISDRGGADTYIGRTGFDALNYSEWHYEWLRNPAGIVGDLQLGTVRGPDGLVDTVSGIEALRGTGRNDVMRGAAADENFRGFRGADSIDGRGGLDRVEYHRDDRFGGTLGIVANLATGRIVDTFGTVDRVVNVERVRGSIFNDTITGSAGDNQLEGREGNDTLTGGAGSDWFRFGVDHGRDRVTDFNRAQGDKIFYSDTVLDLAPLDFSDLTFSLVGGNRVITSPEGTITLVGFSGALIASDFIFD